MKLLELLNTLLNFIEKTSEINSSIYPKSWIINSNEMLFISRDNIEAYSITIENIYGINKNIYTRFTRKKVYEFIENKILMAKRKDIKFTKKISETFFKELENIKPYSRYIISPISGIRLDNLNKINISIFEIGKINQLKSNLFTNDEDGYYIAVKINDIYDDAIAIEEAKNRFSDFIRIIVFLSGKNDKEILIKTGLPSYPSISHEQMYVETSFYQITENMKDEFPSSEMNNRYIEKIPVDNNFFTKNKDFTKLWDIYEKQSLNKNISKKDKKDTMEKRLLYASIAIGESALSRNIKNSIIYTSMALEILFSFNENSMFQRSIADKLSDTFAFFIGVDKETRLSASKLIKTFYGLRSALVHGGNKKVNNDYIVINMYLRFIIKELLNNEKYKNIKTINDLYTMVKEAQYSY
jgi:hypothetical protein